MNGQLQIIMYSRTFGCPFLTIARRVFSEHQVSYQEIFIDQDPEALRRVVQWTGFHSVPTIILANAGEHVPCGPITDLAPKASPRGIDRGPMITEPSTDELEAWLRKFNLI